MKKAISYITSFVMFVTLLFMPNMQAYAANVSLAVSASTVNIGDSVTVTVSVPNGITATVDLIYSSDILSFTSASTDVGVNGSGIRINVGKYAPAGSTSVSVTFKANTSGTASFSASVGSAVDDNTVEDVAVGGASASITVENQTQQPSNPPSGGNDETKKSEDNSLSSIKLSSGTLSPSFKYNVTKYTAKVGYNVKNIVVSATPSNAKATIESVTGNGNVDLAVGDNTIKIVVKAENGVKATYTVVVTRAAQEDVGEGDSETESESESESETQQPPVIQEALQWNGQQLQPAETLPQGITPTDFVVNSIMINSVETPCFTFSNGDLKVLYLINQDGGEGLYVYDDVQQLVYPFVKFESESSYVMVLVPDQANVPAPEHYAACTLSIEGKGVINAYQFVQPDVETESTSWFGAETFYAVEPVATDYYLMYCMNDAGEKGWYVYDSVERTFQRYLGSIHNPIVDTNEQIDETVEHTKDYEKLAAELAAAKKLQIIIIGIAAFVVIVLIIVIINLILRNRSDEDYEDDDYEDDEDDDEYELEEDEDTTEETYDGVEDLNDMDDLEDEDEIEIEFYEMPQEEVVEETVVDDEDDEIEIEFYEMTEDSSVDVTEEDDEVEVEFYDMEALLIQEAIASEKEVSNEEKKVPEKKTPVVPVPVPVQAVYTDDDEDDDDLEFIELD